MNDKKIPAQFLQYATDILGDTSYGLSGSEIVRATVSYAVKCNVNIPHAVYPFQALNKRTALYENLSEFDGPQQYQIIHELCDRHSISASQLEKQKQLRILLAERYDHLASEVKTSEISEPLIEETKHWLDGYPEVFTLYNNALTKYKAGVFHRNLLDDLRLSLEKLLRSVFGNKKSLENQKHLIGDYIRARGGSPEFVNMFVKLVDYYAKYHNTYVKHDDAIIEEEIEFIFEITSSFMKHLIRLGE